ncbi:MAG: hypothetical protein JNM65_11860 [Verrucomicrobiaceae bacterium]|nr:hypothetical protein [Verrucomicrobiaceae bacterium]
MVRIPGVHEVWDPYDAGTAKLIADKLTAGLSARVHDPPLIGGTEVSSSAAPRIAITPNKAPHPAL